MNSMTGFGRSEGKVGSLWYVVEVKSVNHRYLDLRLRLPAAFTVFESLVGEKVRSRFERGSFDVIARASLSPAAGSGVGGRFQVDRVAAESFTQACQSLGLKPTVEAMVATGKIFVPREDSPDDPSLGEELGRLVDQALDGLGKMRKSEGEKLAVVLRSGAAEVGTLADSLQRLASDHLKRIREKLESRIQSLGLSGQGDPQRLEWEIAYYAERSDITEEIDRLRSHAQAFGQMLGAKGSVGRKLDFLTQEMHREVNTLGSKAASGQVTQLVVEGKTLIEKLREQVQNVE